MIKKKKQINIKDGVHIIPQHRSRDHNTFISNESVVSKF